MRLVIAMASVAGLIAIPSSAMSNEALSTEPMITKPAPVIIKSLTDYPGRVRDVTNTQKIASLGVQSRSFFWTKQLSHSEVNLYAKNIIGAGKVQFFHNGTEVAWVNAEDDSDPKLRVISEGPMTGANYLVRTRELVAGKNIFEIYVDGERVLRTAQRID